MNQLSKIKLVGLAFSLMTVLTACPGLQQMVDDAAAAGPEISDESQAASAQRSDLEDELLALINEERVAAGLPELVRDPGLDEIMTWYGADMVLDHHIGHEDINGRRSADRVNYYSERMDVRCSEITAWWTGASARAHYEAYKASAGHHDAYMEVGVFNLGPTTHVGVVVLAGTGPDGSDFEGRPGTYSGLVFCDDVVDVTIDPFSE